MTDRGLKTFENAKVLSFDENSNTFLLDNGKERLQLPKETFETILNHEQQNVRIEKEDVIHGEKGPAIVAGGTVIPEFAMITNHGLQTFKDMKLQKYNEAENSYTIGNENSSMTIQADTFKEITAPGRFEKQFDEKTPEHEKLIESQYNDFFKQRDNTAYNFLHNFGVYCRKEYIKNHQNEKMIARPFYNTISSKSIGLFREIILLKLLHIPKTHLLPVIPLLSHLPSGSLLS